MTNSKQCPRCKKVKELTSTYFIQSKSSSNGFKSACRECLNFERSNWRERHKAALCEKQKLRYFANHDKEKERQRINYRAREERDQSQNPEKIARRREKSRIYSSNNREAIKAYKALWLERGGREKTRKRKRERLRTDPVFRMKGVIGCQMRNALKGKGGVSWKSLVGYSAADLVRHLERQFLSWMTWGNYGSHWHVDHIRPIASFILPDEITACWALSNLRPLSSSRNCSKGAKIELLL